MESGLARRANEAATEWVIRFGDTTIVIVSNMYPNRITSLRGCFVLSRQGVA